MMRDDLYSAICREAFESRQRDVMSFVRSGDFFSLGPSAVNLFLFFEK